MVQCPSRLPAVLMAAASWVASAAAWGGNTHQWISLRALDLAAPGTPVLRALRAHPERLAAFLGASMAPDIPISLARPVWSYSLHQHLHTAEVADALLDAAGGDPVAVAAALGWRSHQVQDSAGARGEDSYPSRKATLRNPELQSRNHLASELLLELLARAEVTAPRAPLYVPADLVARALARTHPAKWVPRPDAAGVAQLQFEFAAQTFVGNTLLDGMLLRLPGTFLNSLGEYFEDARYGDRPGQGLEPAAHATIAALQVSLAGHPHAVRALLAGAPARPAPIPQVRMRLPAAALAAVLGWLPPAVDVPEWLAGTRSERGLTHNPVFDLLVALACTHSATLQTFLDDFEQAFLPAP